jgi:hypothetical protein
MDLEINEVVPIGHPFIQQPSIVRFHKLVAALKFFVDPTRHVQQPLGRHSTAVPKPAIHEYSIFVPEVLHHHVCRHRFRCSGYQRHKIGEPYLFVPTNYPFR